MKEFKPEGASISLPHDHGEETNKLLSNKPSEDAFIDNAHLFALISDSTRLKILWLLYHSEECVINIAAAVEMSSPAVSHHLRILKQAGLITSRKEGKEVYYTRASSPKAKLTHGIIDQTFGIHCNGD